jgi:anti-anti-sigma regulatory factor
MNIRITQRQSVLGVIALLTFLTLLLSIALLLTDDPAVATQGIVISTIGCFIIFSGLLYAYWRGWTYARYIIVIGMTIVVGFVTPEPYITSHASITIFAPPALALILAEPVWVIGSAGALYGLLLLRAGGVGAYASPITLVLTCVVIGSMVVARLVTDTALASSRDHARRAEDERARAEAQANELVDANDLMNRQLDEQRQLLDLVATLETPVVPLADGVLFAPIVGHIDSRRAQALTTRLLHTATEHRARLIVLDISGVSVMDTAVAKALLNTAQALRLLGCDVTLSGISASIAITLINLGVSLEGVTTARSPQEALARQLDTPELASRSGNGKNQQ